MSATATMTALSISPPNPITAPAYCYRVIVREDGDLATTRLRVYAPLSSATPVTYSAGQSIVFERTNYGPSGYQGFQPGEVIGYIQALDVASTSLALFAD